MCELPSSTVVEVFETVDDFFRDVDAFWFAAGGAREPFTLFPDDARDCLGTEVQRLASSSSPNRVLAFTTRLGLPSVLSILKLSLKS
jgi:hypothetical protein